MKPIIDEKQIDQVLSRGVEMVYPTKEDLKKKLMSGERIKLYCGFDPTGPTLHIGHGNQIRKLAEFQKLGHEVVFLIGDFTAMIGDPTDKSAARTQLTKKQVLANLKNYQKQAGAILEFKGKNAAPKGPPGAKVEFNSKWLGKMKFADVLELASKMTVQRMIERDMFQRRIEDGKPIYVHEFMYPMMQGYDSVALNVDLELGGSDQTFNMLAGRDLMKTLKQKEKFVLTLRLLTDPTGKKMGKTEGNMITLDSEANDMFGQVMSWPDEMILLAFEVCTDVQISLIEKIAKAMKDGANPRDFKLQLAQEIVGIYKGEKEAQNARENFINLFQKKEGPDKVKRYILRAKTGKFTLKGNNSNPIVRKKLINVLVEIGLVDSNSEAKRVIREGGVKVDKKIIKDINYSLTSGAHLIQKGKRHFVKVVI